MRIGLRFILTLLFSLFLVSGVECSFASNYIITSGEYELTEYENKRIGEELALYEAMRAAIEQNKASILSMSKVDKGRLSDDVVYVAASSIICIEEKKVEWISERRVVVTIRTSFDYDKVDKVVNQLVTQADMYLQCVDLSKQYENMKTEVAALKQELKGLEDRNKTDEINQKIKKKSMLFLAKLWHDKSNIALFQGNIDEAITCVDTALELDPSYANAYALKGLIEERLNNTNKAIQMYMKAIALNDKYPVVYYKLAGLYMKLGKADDAINYYSKAIESDPYFFQAYECRGHVYEKLDKKQLALNDYLKALELRPQSYFSWTSLGFMYINMNQPKEALEYGKRATRVRFSDCFGHTIVAVAEAMLGRTEEALEDIELAFKLSDRSNPKFKKSVLTVKNTILSGAYDKKR